MRIRTRLAAAIAAVPLTVSVGACGSDPYSQDDGGGGGVVVGSSDISENILLGEIYAQALEAKGVKATKRLDIGSREAYFKLIKSGELAMVPEYNGAILKEIDPDAKSGDTDATNAAVREALPKGLEILDSAKAENKDTVTVTKETAEKEKLESVGDLKDVSGDMVLGAPSEFEKRPQGVPGLDKTYGVQFKEFRPLKSSLIPQALSDGDVQAANLFTTDPEIADRGFVPLEDTKNLFGAQNVTPLIRKDKVDGDARDAIDAVSGKLTTDTLTKLNQRVSVDHDDPDKVAADWLGSQGLD